ncbi:MAG: FixH family protein [Pseudochelatococcus sp.]|jgi:nitrogen fixation protein FixH|uniref:FixH family protein n=1 Tax=Pseudochelatococcus sp. TaxID=2020869 RepID=UPI003D8E50F0
MPTILSSPSSAPAKERRLTGRTVLLCLLGFFGCVTAVNVVMIRAAISTHGGAEKVSSYRAGLNFARDRSAAQAQQTLGWQVDITLPHRDAAVTPAAGRQGCVIAAHGCAASGPASVSVRDADGRPLAGLDARLVLVHPTDSRRDRSVPLADKGGGRYEAAIDVTPGSWGVDLDIDRNGERMFRSSGRVVLN